MFWQILKMGFIRDTRGVTSIEYAFVAALVAMVIIAGLILAGGALGTLWGGIGDCVSSYGKICNL